MPLKGETNSDSGMGLAIHKSASTLGVARQAGSCIRSRTNRSDNDLAAETAPRLGSGFPFHRGQPAANSPRPQEVASQRSQLRSTCGRASGPRHLRFDFALMPAYGRGLTKPYRLATEPGALRASNRYGVDRTARDNAVHPSHTVK